MLVVCSLAPLISPTDPIAVLGILKRVGAPKSIEIQMAGESLFNDGMGVVVFVTLLELASGGESSGVTGVVILLAREVGGGAALGIVTGWFTYWLLKQVDEYQTEVLLTLGLAMGGYALAEALHISARPSPRWWRGCSLATVAGCWPCPPKRGSMSIPSGNSWTES